MERNSGPVDRAKSSSQLKDSLVMLFKALLASSRTIFFIGFFTFFFVIPTITHLIRNRYPAASPQRFFPYATVGLSPSPYAAGARSGGIIRSACLQYKTITLCDAAQGRGEKCSWYACKSVCLTTGTDTETVCGTGVKFGEATESAGSGK